VLDRQTQARLDAVLGPRPRGIFRQFAHLYAASVRAGLRTSAIASADGSAP
jgi:hypothetical protein